MAIGQFTIITRRIGEKNTEETVTMFLNVKLEREWIFNVVNDKNIQFKTGFGTQRISWSNAWKNNSEKVSLDIFFYFLILSIAGFYLSIYF